MYQEVIAITASRSCTIVQQPPVTHKGVWWQLLGEAWHLCPECGHRYDARVAVLEYLPALDATGEQWEKHPGWEVFGFLARWHCPGCFTMTLEVTDSPQVARWGRTLGGWERPATAASPT